MPDPVTLHGPRLTLRPWRLPEDLDGLYAINSDPEVMRFFPNVHDRAESDDWGRRVAAAFDGLGYGFWVAELPGEGPRGEMVGVVGIKPAPFEAAFTPATEIGWRIARRFHRQGLAEEGARMALAYGFGPARLDRIVAWTPPVNEPSWRLMEKLGMRREGSFGHPRLPEGHELHTHLLYAIGRADWIASRIEG